MHVTLPQTTAKPPTTHAPRSAARSRSRLDRRGHTLRVVAPPAPPPLAVEPAGVVPAAAPPPTTGRADARPTVAREPIPLRPTPLGPIPLRAPAADEPYDVDSLHNRREERIRLIVDRVVPALQRYFRAEVHGLERIPAGAGIYIGNHNGGALTPDSFLLGAALYERGGLDDLPYALAHDMVVRWPLLRDFFLPLGAVRACPENARRVCAAGKKLLIYPGGDAEAMRSFRDRNRIVFGERRGYLRLALREGVPIIPAVAHGAHATSIILDDGKWIVRKLGLDRAFRLNAWPITLSIPWGLTFWPPPIYFPLPSRITIEVLEPIRFDRAGTEAAADARYVEACHERVVGAMQAALDRLARGRRG